jgi:para-nitrobenzyl esterase
MLKELGFAESDAEKLETIPFDKMAAAYKKVSPALREQGVYVGGNPIPNGYYVGDPRKVGFTDHAKTIPLMAGSVFGEMAFGPGVHNKYDLTEAQIKPMIKEKYGDSADELITLFKKAYPNKNLADLLFLDSMCRAPSINFAQKKAAHQESPTYLFLFAYEFPYDWKRRRPKRKRLPGKKSPYAECITRVSRKELQGSIRVQSVQDSL